MALFSFLLSVMTMQFIASVVAVKSGSQCSATVRKNFEAFANRSQEMEEVVIGNGIFLQMGSHYFLMEEICPVSTTGYEVTIKVGEARLHVSENIKVFELQKTLVNFVTDDLPSTASRLCVQPAASLKNNILLNQYQGDIYKSVTKPDPNLKCGAVLNDLSTSLLSSQTVKFELLISFHNFYIKFNLSTVNGRITELEYLPDTQFSVTASVTNVCVVEPSNETVKKACECLANLLVEKRILEVTMPPILACQINDDEFAPLRNAVNCSP